MRRVLNWFRSLPKPVAWIIGAGAIIFLMGFAVAFSATAWEFTNSPEFCGETCHTMPPEYTAYQISPHARVDCVDCHLGQDSFRKAVPAKAREITHVTNALFNTYEPPIYVKSLRPARDTCEQCHNPEKFSSDSFAEIRRFAEDEENTMTRNFMVFKTGGGSRSEGLGRGIHWHIENEVYYYTDDPLKQTIPYVQEVTPQGQVIEYFDVEAGLPPDFGQQVEGQLQRMDCIDCHTRISHLFRSPTDAMDDALARQVIDDSIPFIKQKGVEVLSQEYPDQETGLQAIKDLGTWYQENYPDFSRQNEIAIDKAIRAIQDIFTVTVFPNMGVGWHTHPDNSAHSEFPGCFRCHDGKHTSPGGRTVRLECNVCHSIPGVVEAGQPAPVVSIERAEEPDSHKDSNWLARHRYVFDETCADCHDVSNPGGTDNSSFCSNSACHGTEWKFVGLNAPVIRELSAPPRTPSSGEIRLIPHPIGPNTDCTICHGLEGVHPFPESHASFDQSICTQCHQTTMLLGALDTDEVPSTESEPAVSAAEGTPAASPEPTRATAGAALTVPHTLEGREDCLLCHGENGVKPYPEDHAGRTGDTCLMCHQPSEPDAMEAATATPTRVPTRTPASTATSTTVPTRAPAATATPAPEPTEGPSPTAEPTAAPLQGGGVPAVPHPVEGREDCLICHGENGIKPYPEDHVGRSADTCLACHQPES